MASEKFLSVWILPSLCRAAIVMNAAYSMEAWHKGNLAGTLFWAAWAGAWWVAAERRAVRDEQ